MRNIDKIVVHCSAGNMNDSAADIVRFHTSPASRGGRGWNTPGYHYFIDKVGNISQLVSEDRISNGVKGHNANAINICYAGGVDQESFKIPMDTRTDAQKVALISLIRSLRVKYPQAIVYGHCDFAAKACPSFDAKNEYKNL